MADAASDTPGFFGPPTDSAAAPAVDQPAETPGFFNQEKPPEPAPPAPPAEGHFGSDVMTTIGAGIEKIGAAVQEGSGESKRHDAKVDMWRAMILPDAVRRAQAKNIVLTDDAGVQAAAEHLGIRPDQFANKWPDYVNMSPEDLDTFIRSKQADIAAGGESAAEGASRRKMATGVEQDIESGYGRAGKFGLHVAAGAPDVLGALGVGAIPGGQIPAAALLATDFGLRAYSNGRDAGLNDEQAKLYGALSGATAVAPEVPVMAVLSKAPGASQILQSTFGKAVAESTAGKIAGVANAQGLAMITQTALQQQIDKGFLHQDMTLREALGQLAESYLTGVVTGAPVGAVHAGVHRLVNGPQDSLSQTAQQSVGPALPEVREVPHTAMEIAEQHARMTAAENGGDLLDQTVAATGASAVVGAHHDAVAYHGAMELRRAQAAEAAARDAELEAQGQREQGLNQAEATKASTAPGADEAFRAREVQQAMQKDRDFAAAKNQAGQQEIEASQTAEAGAEKGGANEAAPTLGEALPPEQVSALQQLRERLAAQKAAPQEPAPEAQTPEPVTEEDEFKKLPPLQAKRVAAAEAAKPPQEAPAPAGEEELPREGPPPVTAQTLAQRRQAALDEAMAAKVRGPAPPEVEPANAVPTPAAKPNRLVVIRAAAQKREQPPPPERTPMEFVARDPESGEEIKRFSDFDTAKAYKEEHPEADITHEAAALSSRAGRGTGPAGWTSVEGGGTSRDDAAALQRELVRMGPARMSHDELKEHLSDISAKQHPRSFRIHPSQFNYEDLHDPQLAETMKDAHARGSNIYGAYRDGTVHVFADAFKPGDKESVLSTVVHESTHLGLDSFLGPKYRSTMESIYKDIKGTAWATKYAARRRLDLSNPQHQALLADEYAAHMAENIAAGKAVNEGLPAELPETHWQKIVTAVRAGLRKLGLVKEWTDRDIAHLIRQAQAHIGLEPSASGREGAALKDEPGRLSIGHDEDDKFIDEHYPPDSAEAIGHKLGRTMEEQAAHNPGFVKDPVSVLRDLTGKAGRAVKDFSHDQISKYLALIGLRNLPDHMSEGKMPSLHRFIDTHDKMDGYRGALNREDGKLQDEWSRWNAKRDDRGYALSDLMHAATILGHDPSKPYEERYTAEERAMNPDAASRERYERSLYNSLRDQYNSRLDDQGRSLFQRVRDNYSDKRTAVLDSLTRRIEATDADGATKKNLMTMLRKKFESGKVKGVYFPLQRFGQHWARALDKDGNSVAFSRFENKEDQRNWLANMRKAGLDVDAGSKIENRSEMERIDPDFVKKVMTAAHDADPSGALEKEIWQTYLQAMPEMSMRKHMIVRQGRLGFARDALRAFSFNSMHGAHQLARLEYGHQLDIHVRGAKAEARGLEANAAQNPEDAGAQSDAAWGAHLASELDKRLDWINNPRAAKWASNLTRFGFGWYLGFAPATAFRIFSQNPMLAQPLLAKKFGQLGASRELIKASTKWASTFGNFKDTLRGNELKMFQEAEDMGMFSNTNTTTLAKGGDTDNFNTGGAWNAFTKAAGYMFNGMEHHNRMTTLMAAYRLGIKKGMSHEAAAKLARQLTWDAHFDYNNANRPRVLQNDFAKTAGLFKQYSWNVTYRLGRELNDMLKGETPEVRAQATHAFSALMARMMVFAGIAGVPAFGAATAAINAIMGTKDTPYDAKAQLHRHLNDTLGQTAGDAIMTGPAGALSGASLSGGASYNDLWYRPPGREMSAEGTMLDAMGQLLGPLAAIPLNIGQGIDEMHKGHTERGLEHFLPPEAAGLAKAVRYATEGVKTLAGESIIKKEDLSGWSKMLQAAGFTPQPVADAYEQSNAGQNYAKAVSDRKADIERRLEAAIENHEPHKDIDAERAQFLKEHPGFGIKGRSVVGAMRSKAHGRARSIGGQVYPKGLTKEVAEKF